MRHLLVAASAAALTLSACGQGQRTEGPVGTNTATASPTASPANSNEAPLALGLTRRQLEDADLLDATGAEIGEVERVLTDASGAVTGLVVEVENTTPDRMVTVPLDGLSVVENGNDRDLRGTHSRDSLMAMPETPR